MIYSRLITQEESLIYWWKKLSSVTQGHNELRLTVSSTFTVIQFACVGEKDVM